MPEEDRHHSDDTDGIEEPLDRTGQPDQPHKEHQIENDQEDGAEESVLSIENREHKVSVVLGKIIERCLG